MPPLRKSKEEIRTKRRITKVLPVDCTIVSLPLNQSTPHFLGAGDGFGGRTINISQSGLQVHSDIELDPLTVVDVTVSLDRPAKRVTVRTQVAWAKRNAADLYGRWALGLHIIDARPGELEILNAYYSAIS
jgi:hypothetical protein